MKSLALLLLRLTAGGLLAGHGGQKLFGWFEGPGLQGTAGWLESMDMKPGNVWAQAAGGSEFGGGVLTALGLFHPLGPIGIISSMVMATLKVHAGKPIWVTSGGAELPVTNTAVSLALILAGPGKISLDSLLGIRVPPWLVILAILGAAAGIYVGVTGLATPPPATENQAGGKLQGGKEAHAL